MLRGHRGRGRAQEQPRPHARRAEHRPVPRRAAGEELTPDMKVILTIDNEGSFHI